jgi:hypothetical protein
MLKRLWVAGLLAGLLFSSTQGTEVRLSGMGELGLVVRDETNQVSLFRFGRNVSGLFADESLSTAKGDVSYGGRISTTGGLTDSLEYQVIGEVLPSLLRTFLPSLSSSQDLKDIPEFDFYPSGASFVWRQKKQENYVWGQEASKSQAILLEAGYNRVRRKDHRIPDRVATPRLSLGYNMELNSKFGYGFHGDFFNAGYANDTTKESSSLTNFGGGLGCRYSPTARISLGPQLNVYYPSFSTKSGNVTETYSGPCYTGGLTAIFLPSWATWGGNLLLTSANLNHKGESAKTSGYEGELRFLTAVPRLPFDLGGEAGYSTKHPLVKDTLGYRSYDSQFSEWNLGGGLGFKVSRVFLGFEAGMRKQTQTDHLGGSSYQRRDTTFIESEQTAKLGAELALSVPVYLRAGYVWSSFDPDTKVSLNGETRNKITLGLGVRLFGGKYLGDLAYQHRTSGSEDKTVNHRVTGNGVMLVVKGMY